MNLPSTMEELDLYLKDKLEKQSADFRKTIRRRPKKLPHGEVRVYSKEEVEFYVKEKHR